MEKVTLEDIKKLYLPPKSSHKGQNGKLTIIGGSHLFHGASLWSLKIASRIVDMVYYSSIPENHEIAQKLKSELYDFICVPRHQIEPYLEESDAILIGPGLTRETETKTLTQKLLFQFPQKKWVIDAGSLQMMDKEWLKKLKQVIITPHVKEFFQLFFDQPPPAKISLEEKQKLVNQMTEEYGCVIVLKGPTDIICSPQKCVLNTTGNEGMTKGGTGDCLAGLVAALACKNDLFLAASAGTFINGRAGDQLYQKVGPYFNASDLCDQIPLTLKNLLNF